MQQIVQDNANAIFAILGTLVGAALTFLGTWFLQSQQAKQRLLEKVLDRRIQAHENVIELSKLLRIMFSLGYSEADGELSRAPSVMESPESFNDFLSRFSHVGADSSTWLSTEVTREFNFVQDYLVNLYEFLKNSSSDKFPKVGRLVRQDFIDFSASLEKLAFNYFSKDLTRMKMNDLTKWHKYPKETTIERLNKTMLFKNREEIRKILDGSQ